MNFIKSGGRQTMTDFAQNNPGTIPPEMILEYSDLPLSARLKVKDYNEAMRQREEEMLQAQLEVQREGALVREQGSIAREKHKPKPEKAKANKK